MRELLRVVFIMCKFENVNNAAQSAVALEKIETFRNGMFA